MHFPKFWAKAEENNFKAWGWSDISQNEAINSAKKRAHNLSVLLSHGRPPRAPYGYSDQPLREEVINSVDLPELAESVVITRNGYGALILNSPQVAFLDVDRKPPLSPLDVIKQLTVNIFKEKQNQYVASREEVQSNCMLLCELNSALGLRFYETAAGFRIMVTQDLCRPDGELIREVSRVLKVDPLYRRLSLRHRSFRARLTPKPWRCGHYTPKNRWPWSNEWAKKHFEQWQKSYAEKSEGFATCRFIGQFGNAIMHPAVHEVVKLHDSSTKAFSPLPLA
jgi:hypothetical protein